MLPEDMSEGKSPYEISAAMKKMNISTDKKHWVAPEIAHRTGTTVSIEDQTYMVNGRAYRMTDAKVGIAINHTDGVLVVGKAYGPVFRGQKRTPPVIGNDLPQLKKLSDVLWGQWTICHNQFHTNLSNVRCIFLYMLENEDSKKILLKAIRKYKDDNMAEIGEWPAVISIPADCEAGKAILGSYQLPLRPDVNTNVHVGMPIAACASYFLSDHQNVLGKKKITRFDIYWVKVHEVHEGGPNVICHVGNA